MTQAIARIGNVIVGGKPRIVGTISTVAGLRTFDSRRVACDLVEIRLDRLGAETTDWLTQCQAISLPLILTVRLAGEGGGWTRLETERREFFMQALENLAAIDVELQSALLPELADAARGRGRAVIVSVHDFDRTPPIEDLFQIAAKAAQFGAIVKIATMITCESDVETLKLLLARKLGVPLCVIGMGAMGTASRMLLPKLGSCLAYGYLDAPAAPGQLSAEEIKRLLV
jgi:3-dehydroquinate dehydratase-1